VRGSSDAPRTDGFSLATSRRRLLSKSAGAVRGTSEGKCTAAIPTVAFVSEEMTEMFTIEEENGSYTGPTRRHNGYCAGDFSRAPMRTATELAGLTRLRPPTFRTMDVQGA
jgi:hypothetical protein